MRRFSLATLLLFTLALGAGAVVYRNWEPWALVYTHPGEGWMLEEGNTLALAVVDPTSKNVTHIRLLHTQTRTGWVDIPAPTGERVKINGVRSLNKNYFLSTYEVQTGRPKTTSFKFENISQISLYSASTSLPQIPVAWEFEQSQDGSTWLLRYPDGRTEIREAATGEIRCKITGIREKGSSFYPDIKYRGYSRIALAPDGSRVVINEELFDTKNGQSIKQFDGTYGKAFFSPDSQWLSLKYSHTLDAVTYSPKDNFTQDVFSAKDGQPLIVISARANPFCSPIYLASENSGVTKLYDLQDREWLPIELKGAIPPANAISPDGKRLLTRWRMGEDSEQIYPYQWRMWDIESLLEDGEWRSTMQPYRPRDFLIEPHWFEGAVVLETDLWDFKSNTIRPLMYEYLWTTSVTGQHRIVAQHRIFNVQGVQVYALPFPKEVAGRGGAVDARGLSADEHYILLGSANGSCLFEQRRNEAPLARYLSPEFSATVLLTLLFLGSFVRDIRSMRKIAPLETSR